MSADRHCMCSMVKLRAQQCKQIEQACGRKTPLPPFGSKCNHRVSAQSTGCLREGACCSKDGDGTPTPSLCLFHGCAPQRSHRLPVCCTSPSWSCHATLALAATKLQCGNQVQRQLFGLLRPQHQTRAADSAPRWNPCRRPTLVTSRI